MLRVAMDPAGVRAVNPDPKRSDANGSCPLPDGQVCRGPLSGRAERGRPVSATPPLQDDESLVDLRCSAVVLSGSCVLLIRRWHGAGGDDWVLPGGRPRAGETMRSTARREVLEETGLRVTPTRCALVGEAVEPGSGLRTVDLVFLTDIPPDELTRSLVGEADTVPEWVALADLPSLRLRPPIGGYLPALQRAPQQSAAYLGNLWRPTTSPDQDAP